MHHLVFLAILSLALLDCGELNHSGLSAPDSERSPMVIPNAHTGDLHSGLSVQAPHPIKLDSSYIDLLRLSSIYVLENNFVFSENSLTVFFYVLKSKNESRCNQATAMKRILLCVLLLISGNVQPNPGPTIQACRPKPTSSDSYGVAALKQQQTKLLQTVNHAQVLWNPNA